MNELKQKATQGVFWSGTEVWGARAVSFVIFALLSRILSPEAFGIVALASLYIFFIKIFQDTGFSDAIVQRENLEPDHLNSAFWANLLLGSVLAMSSIFTAGLIAKLFNEPEITNIIKWLSLSFILEGLSGVQQAILKRKLAFKELALRKVLATFVSGIFGVILAFLGFGVWSLVAQKLINLLVGVFVLWRVSDWRPGFSVSKKHFIELMSFGLNMVGIRILNYINGNLDNLLIGYFLGSTLLGFYTIAYKIFDIFKDLLSSIITSVAFPTFSRLQKNPERLRRVFYRVIRYTSLISFPAFVGMSIIAPELIPAFFGPQWTLSIPVLRVLAFIGILHSIFYFHASLIYAVGKPSWRLGMMVLNAISNIIAFSIAVRWGIVAVATAYVIRGYLLSPLEIWMVNRLVNINIRTYFHQFLSPILGSLAMAIVIFGLKHSFLEAVGLELQIAVYILTGVVIYGLVIKLTFPSIWQDVFNLVRLIIPERFILRNRNI